MGESLHKMQLEIPHIRKVYIMEREVFDYKGIC